VRVPKTGAKAVLLVSDCSHLAGEVLEPLQQRALFYGRANASERRLGCNLRDSVRAAGCCVQAVLMLYGENSLYVGE
jgi:hypothetical protein